MSESNTKMGAKINFWGNVLEYYSKQVSDETLKLYVWDSREMDVNELKRAFEIHRNGPKAEFFPLPCVLRRYLVGDPTDEAEECAARIFESIRKFGYQAGSEARKFMGELAWDVVDGFGGWSNLCTSNNLGNEATLRAQMRNMAQAKINRKLRGAEHKVPGIDYYGKMPELPTPDEKPAIENKQKSLPDRPKLLGEELGNLAITESLPDDENE
jgi:hypothetical protein